MNTKETLIPAIVLAPVTHDGVQYAPGAEDVFLPKSAFEFHEKHKGVKRDDSRQEQQAPSQESDAEGEAKAAGEAEQEVKQQDVIIERPEHDVVDFSGTGTQVSASHETPTASGEYGKTQTRSSRGK